MVQSNHFVCIRRRFLRWQRMTTHFRPHFYPHYMSFSHLTCIFFWYFGIFVSSEYVESSLSDITSWMIFLTFSNPPDLLSWVSNPLLPRVHTFCYHSLILYWTFQYSFHSASFPYLKPLIRAHAHAHIRTKDATQFLHVTHHMFSKCPHDISYINPWILRSSGMCTHSRFVVVNRWLIPTPNQRCATSQRSEVLI
jgi:hypothetical protein